MPFLKWVGGKRQLIFEIKKYLPKKLSNSIYYEPFVGGGALFFHLQPKKAIINDSNSELINVYKVIRDNIKELIQDLKKHKNEVEYYYEIRALDRCPLFTTLSDVEKASRIIFLNKTCYNGLYRVNNLGEFNTPFGKYKNPNIVNEPVLKAVHKFLHANDIEIINGDYESALSSIPTNSFAYLDPPYHPVSDSSNFTGYVQGGWNENDQISLKKTCDLLNEKGIKFLLSNSATDFIKNLYSSYQICIVKANRSINSDGEKRGLIDELLIRNYE
ncbi:MAG: DNA adenine methylase [Prevotellaceae bacterium]|jgi:DNA adenine methylase|nr:DNA adenine methylase [Prevotellaceae bacterium]